MRTFPERESILLCTECIMHYGVATRRSGCGAQKEEDIVFNSSTSLGSMIGVLEREVEEKTKALFILKAFLAQPVTASTETPATSRIRTARGANTHSAAKTAVEILREAGRPLHGLREIVPALMARGYSISPAGLPSALIRFPEVVRVAPGTFAYQGGGEAAAAPT
jgi:hypothetical protein